MVKRRKEEAILNTSMCDLDIKLMDCPRVYLDSVLLYEIDY